MMPDEDKAQSESELLKQLLALREYPCPVCGYNLKGIKSDKCPECGANLDISVISADLKLGPWLAALLGFGLPLGFASILVVLFLVSAIADDYFESSDWIFAGVLAVLALMEGLALGVLVRNRRRFWRKSKKTQRRTAIVYIGISIILTIIVISIMYSTG